MTQHTSKVIRKIVMVVMIGFGILGGLFAGGYAWGDLGILKGTAVVASYAVPMAVVSWLAWRKPSIALPVMVAGAILVAAIAVAEALNPRVWGELWFNQGPGLAISGFAVSVPLAVYAYHWRARMGGGLLLLNCAMPLFAGVLVGTQEGPIIGGSTSAGVLPGLVAGVILLIVGDGE